MACRKAAYRAQVELSEWMEQQQEAAAESAAELEREQRKIWTPPHILDQCCLGWLVHGPELFGRRSTAASGGAIIRRHRGCSGGCGKDHVRITFNYEPTTNETTATLSHSLDPLVQYFEALCQEGAATRMKSSAYLPRHNAKVSTEKQTGKDPIRFLLHGSLDMHLKKIQDSSNVPQDTMSNQDKQQQTQQQCCPFGYHLVKVSENAITASKRVHAKQQEKLELERQTKRQKVWGSAVAPPHLFQSVLDIFCHDSTEHFREHLTLAELAWMKQLSPEKPPDHALGANNHHRMLGYSATRMAEERMKQIRLSYSVLLNCHLTSIQAVSSNTQKEGTVFVNDQRTRIEYYTVAASHLPLVLQQQGSTPSLDRFVPETEIDFEISRLNNHGGEGRDQEFPPFGDHMIRIYLEPSPEATTLPERDCLFTAPLEIARCRINRHQISSHCQSGEAGASPSAQETRQHTISDLTFQVSSVPFHNGTSTDQPELANAQKSNLALESFRFGFDDLVGLYVRKKLPLAKKHLQHIKTKRPVRPMEKNFVKALAKAAREAPGSANAFAGFQGW